ncbi:hypothetical protein Droror1_Dr00005297 [Drosera rotundifolia]
MQAFFQVARVRNTLAYATHKFFQENGFVWISSPIITASDCEGAGEQFCVTTLDLLSHSNLCLDSAYWLEEFHALSPFLGLFSEPAFKVLKLL